MKTLYSKAPKVLPALHLMIDDLMGSTSPDALGDHLGVSSATARRWMSCDAAPRAAALALFWETRWGLSVLDAEAVNLVRSHVGLNNALRRENATLRARIARLELIGQFGSANEPMMINVR